MLMKKRIISAMLALLMAFSTLGVFCTVLSPVSADETTEGGEGEVISEDEAYVAIVDAALTTSYLSPQDKIDSDENMRLAAKYGYYELYVNDYTGEVAVKDITTDQILLSNPYDVPSYTTIANATKAELLSQIEIGYTDNGTSKVFYSYTEAAKRGQIRATTIKNGLRVDYTLGREDANYLAPGMITEARMIEMILPFIDDTLEDYHYKNIIRADGGSSSYDLIKLLSYYVFQDPVELASLDETGEALKKAQETYPALKKLNCAIYVRKTQTPQDQRKIENIIKTYCPNYTTEEMEKDHEMTGYVSDELDPPLFKLALEYTLCDDGLLIRLPANGIRFNSTLYTLEYVTPLHYFGAGNMNNEGYLFYPDGSGAIFYYEDLVSKAASSISGKVYGADFAYHEVSGKHQEAIRVPVFGAINETKIPVLDDAGNVVSHSDDKGNVTIETTSVVNGFLTILEEGDAMANITAGWGGARHNFASVYTTYFPRPKDTYDLSGSMTVGADSTWTVEASRKYTGSYKMRVIMLSSPSEQLARAAQGRKSYDASYVGMAKAYSDYLVNTTKTLTPMTALDVQVGQVPLYIESFGTVPDTERILSVPVNVDVPLTTMEDIRTMYAELNANGISNVNFKLKGFSNDGMYSTYPAKLKWMDEVGGADGFKALVKEAKDKNYGIYPDFDFMYVSNKDLFDGVNLRYAAARTIDNRYSSRQLYNATYQEFVSYYDICVTPVMVEEYYAKFTQEYAKYDPVGISVSTLGSDLNSDFGDKNPTNREDAKKILSSVLSGIRDDYRSVMTEGGNIYTLTYVDHLLNAALDSSRFTAASRSVPFVGMVLHGYVNFAGSAINMAGNINYQVLKAIENGAGLYFTLSYRNTSLLKEYKDLSQYYSVNYKIWAGTYDDEGNLVEPGELFDVYNRVNNAIGMLQTAKIMDHAFLIGERVPTEAEIAADEKIYADAYAAAEKEAYAAAEKALLAEYREKLASGEVEPGQLPAVQVEEADILALLEKYDFEKTETTSQATDAKADYEHTKYTLDDGMIVLVTYEGGRAFILNYNIHQVAVNLDGTIYTLEPYGYQAIER